jgi:hypothetical protein
MKLWIYAVQSKWQRGGIPGNGVDIMKVADINAPIWPRKTTLTKC